MPASGKSSKLAKLPASGMHRDLDKKAPCSRRWNRPADFGRPDQNCTDSFEQMLKIIGLFDSREEMADSASASVVRSEFNVFLFARIGADRNDTPLSVLSALARLNIDPWQEAAELARLPREAATQRLASSIAALADGPSAHLEHGTLAAGLIALLPRYANSEVPSGGTLPDAGDIAKFRAGMGMCAVLIIVMMATQWIVASLQTPVRPDNSETPTSSIVSPPPPNSSQ
jgi:hypothetical protein